MKFAKAQQQFEDTAVEPEGSSTGGSPMTSSPQWGGSAPGGDQVEHPSPAMQPSSPLAVGGRASTSASAAASASASANASLLSSAALGASSPQMGCAASMRSCALCHEELNPSERVGLLGYAQRAPMLAPRTRERQQPAWGVGASCMPCPPEEGGASEEEALAAAESASMHAARAARESEHFVRLEDLSGKAADDVLHTVVGLMHQQQQHDRELQERARSAEGREEELSRTQRWLRGGAGETGLHVRTCGHEIHESCLKRCLGSLRPDKLNLDDTEWTCPVCKRISNVLIPTGGVPMGGVPMGHEGALAHTLGQGGAMGVPPPAQLPPSLLGSVAARRHTEEVKDGQAQQMVTEPFDASAVDGRVVASEPPASEAPATGERAPSESLIRWLGSCAWAEPPSENGNHSHNPSQLSPADFLLHLDNEGAIASALESDETGRAHFPKRHVSFAATFALDMHQIEKKLRVDGAREEPGAPR